MRKKERYRLFIEYFSLNMPDAGTELKYKNAYELLVATILSAQCTDKRVNQTTPKFFKTFPDVKKLAKSSFEEVLPIIKSCSYPNSKAKHLVDMAKMLVADFNGKVPSEVEDLEKLPGVGRKTANVVASVEFKKPVMAVDTHVFRVSSRIGLTVNIKTALDAEKQLVNNLPEELIVKAHHWMILHGRYVCQAKVPKCNQCGIKDFCVYFAKSQNKVEISRY